MTPDYPDVFEQVPNPDHDPNNPDPNIPPTITEHTVSGACPIREDFTLNLYLKDELDDPEDDVAFAVQKMTRVGFAKDATGRPYGVKQNGDLTSPSESDEGTHIAAELDMHYNEYTGSYQSGNRTILAKITKTVGVAQAPNVEDLEGADNDETLNELTDNYIQMGTG